jgi:multiple antibiotic resistance protein
MAGPLTALVKYTLLVVGALFPIVNPLGNTPIFLSLTRGLSSRARIVLARMIAVNGLILILASIFIGTHILAFFGISLPVVQVAGGLVVISTGWALLRQPNDDGDGGESHRECNEANYSRQAFYPLTLPSPWARGRSRRPSRWAPTGLRAPNGGGRSLLACCWARF